MWQRAQLTVRPEFAAGGGDDVVECGGTDVGLGNLVLVADVVVGAGDEKAAAHFDGWIVPPDDVAGEMFDDQPVKRLVVVERSDAEVAKWPEVVDDEVAFEAVALAKP